MSKNQEKETAKAAEMNEAAENTDNVQENSEAAEATEQENNSETEEKELTKEEQLELKVKALEENLEKEKKEYLFLMAEFDNFRKRTLKEKAELIKDGATKAFKDILPVIDDFERALEAMSKAEDVQAVKEGVELIHNKFMKYLDQNGVKEMETNGQVFDADIHEAVTTFPTDDENMKGKIIDTVQKGYSINDKVLRHAKVVVGQ